ncbi:Pre-mRNA-splicing factor cwf19 [Elasticomyces elasticus]|nr:Pre-mRNA-splicing factor cwf19 [Elasticomyces elasticus]
MGLEDFERELAESKAEQRRSKRERSRSRDRERKHRHHRHHSPSRHQADVKEKQRTGHRHKRSRHHHDSEHERAERSSKRRHGDSSRRSRSPQVDDEEDEWVEKETITAPPTENILDERIEHREEQNVQRDSWMEAPSALDIDYVQRQRKKSPPNQFVSASREDHNMRVHKSEVQHMLERLEEDGEGPDEQSAAREKVKDEPAQHDVPYTFGDAGSSWRMTKLHAVYRQAKESHRPIEDVAMDRFGDLRSFDDAREEERELDRRKTYGKDYVGLEKPSGEFYQERKMNAGIYRKAHESQDSDDEFDKELDSHLSKTLPQGKEMREAAPLSRTVPLDQSSLNKLKSRLLKAQARKTPDAAKLEAEYNAALSAAANTVQPDTIVLSNMENRLLAGDRSGEVTDITNRRGRERGLVDENEDMSIEDMVRHERRTRGIAGGESRAFAERIAKDGKFDNNLDYMDDNANKLAKRVVKSEINLRNTAIGDFQKMQKTLDACPLCHHEDKGEPPAAPIVSLATRTYLTLPTEPEIAAGSAVIVPIPHRRNLLECDDDEWEEIRNSMKSLTRLYHAKNQAVIFYENAAQMHKNRHAALFAVPLPLHLADAAPAFFREAILSADEEWAQHKKLIDTLKLSERAGYGKPAFRKSLAKEMPYFHVWFTLDGGLGHVVEDERRWPKGDLFAREIIGGMLDKGPEVIKRQGRWVKGADSGPGGRVEKFRKKWHQFDWTRALVDAGA